jgi:hypothetical protein
MELVPEAAGAGAACAQAEAVKTKRLREVRSFFINGTTKMMGRKREATGGLRRSSI